MKIKIGENEYEPDFQSTLAKWAGIPTDRNNKTVDINDNIAALNELASLRIYKDDYETTKERLEECLKNSRCPECGCGDVIEAESNECGCDAPVCAVECPETLAEAYVRVCNELVALRQERDALKARVEELERENLQLAFDDYRIHGKDATKDGDA